MKHKITNFTMKSLIKKSKSNKNEFKHLCSCSMIEKPQKPRIKNRA